MLTLDVCRRVWHEERDPLALCEAVRQCRLPSWLIDALLVLLTEDQAGAYRPVKRGLWQRRTRHAKHAALAHAVASLRGNSEAAGEPMKWEAAQTLAAEAVRARFDDMPKATWQVAKKWYTRVGADLELHPSRYYTASAVDFSERLDRAWQRYSAVTTQPERRSDTAPTRKIRRNN